MKTLKKIFYITVLIIGVSISLAIFAGLCFFLYFVGSSLVLLFKTATIKGIGLIVVISLLILGLYWLVLKTPDMIEWSWKKLKEK
jgi:hypothetical protein